MIIWGVIIALLLLTVIVVITVNLTTAGTCSGSSDCPNGYLCLEGQCKAGIGTACLEDSDCVTGAYCIRGICRNRINPTTPLLIPRVTTGPANPAPVNPTPVNPTPVTLTPVSPTFIGDTLRVLSSQSENTSLTEGSGVIEIVSSQDYQVDHQVLDVGLHEDGLLILERDGLRLEKENYQQEISCSLTPQQVAHFNGYIILLVDDQIYYLTEIKEGNHWTLDLYQAINLQNQGIIRISATLDEEVLALQKEDRLVLLRENGSITEIDQFPIHIKRVFGLTENDYLDLDLKDSLIYYQDQIVKRGIHDACLDSDGNIITTEKGSRVKIINWKPFYY